MSNAANIFRKNLLALMEALNVTQAELSERSGIPQGRISVLMNTVDNPKLKTIESIAEALRVTAAEIITDASAAPRASLVREPGSADIVELWIEIGKVLERGEFPADLMEKARTATQVRRRKKP